LTRFTYQFPRRRRKEPYKLLFFMSVILHDLTDFSTLDWYGWRGAGRSGARFGEFASRHRACRNPSDAQSGAGFATPVRRMSTRPIDI
jgi:hypothetical protein